MKYEGALLVVKDMQASRHFYQDLLSAKPILDLGEYVVFEGGFCLLTEGHWRNFLQNSEVKLGYGHLTSQLGFEDEDIDSFVERLRTFKDVQVVCPLREYPWGQRSIRFYDPDRHLVEVGEDMKVVTMRYLKSGMTVDQTIAKVMYPRAFVEMCQMELGEG